MSALDDIAAGMTALTPGIEALKAGTAHEGHDGWGMNGRGPGRFQCSCGGSLDELLGLPPARVFHMAHCVECAMPLPFDTAAERDAWANEHETTGHRVTRYESIR